MVTISVYSDWHDNCLFDKEMVKEKMLSKKHYTEIAKALRDTRAETTNIPNCTAALAIEILEGKLCEYFKYDNINFNKTKFLEASRE